LAVERGADVSRVQVDDFPAGTTNVAVDINTERPFTPQHLRNPSTNFGLLINAVLRAGQEVKPVFPAAS
jgi:hypothetical protein